MTKPKINKAVVTGGLGFIGSHLAEALVARGVETTIVDNASTGAWKIFGPFRPIRF